MLNESFNEREVFDMIQEEISLIHEEREVPAKKLSPEDRLGADLGLKSLDLARLVAALEIRTGADPFQELVAITSVRTVGDLQDAYKKFLAGGGAADQVSDELLEAQRRAAARKEGGRGRS